MAKLVEGGVPITHCNIGNMHYHEGKKQLTKTVSVDEQDLAAFRKMVDAGVTCTIQNTPDAPEVDIKQYL